MKKKIIVLIFVGILFSCINKEKTQLEEKIKNLEVQMDTMAGLNLQLYDELAKLYIEFAEKYPDDTISPEFLFRSANIYRSMNRGNEALKFYKKIEEQYPEYYQLPMAIFFQAVVYEDVLKNFDKAREHYKRFIENFPNHAFADDARVLLDNLGKSPEELIKSFEAKKDTIIRDSIVVNK